MQKCFTPKKPSRKPRETHNLFHSIHIFSVPGCVKWRFSLDDVQKPKIKTNTETDTLSISHTETMTQTHSFGSVAAQILIESFTPSLKDFPNVVTVSSLAGVNYIGTSSVSTMVFVLKGARLTTWQGLGQNFAPTEWDRYNCTNTYLNNDVSVVKCSLYWFPSTYVFNLEYSTAFSIMTGHLYYGALGYEYACGQMACRTYPTIKQISGCFTAGSGTFGCNPFNGNSLLLNLTAKHIYPAMDPILYFGDEPAVVCMYYEQQAFKESSIAWEWGNITGTHYKENYVRCVPETLHVMQREESSLRLHIQGKLHPLHSYGPNSTEMIPEFVTPQVIFAPAVTSLSWNASYYQYDISTRTTKNAQSGEQLRTGSGWCVSSGNGLHCFRPNALLLRLHGWNLGAFCTAQSCLPKVVAVGAAAYLPTFAEPVHSISNNEIAVVLTSEIASGHSGEFVVTIQSATGLQAYSNVTLAISHPPVIFSYLCTDNYTQSNEDPNRGGIECSVPGGFTFYGDGFDASTEYMVTFVPTSTHPDYTTDATLGPQLNVTCDVVEVLPSRLRCEIDNTYLKNDYRLGTPEELYSIVGGTGRGNYTIVVTENGVLRADFRTNEDGDNVILYSPPALLSVTGCNADGPAAVSQHCDGTQDVTLHGKRLPPTALLYYQRTQILENRLGTPFPWAPCEVSWVFPYYRTLTCKVPYARRMLPEVRTFKVVIEGRGYASDHVVAHFDASPNVYSVEGCAGDGNGTQYCHSYANRQHNRGRAIVFRGSGFYGYGNLRFGFGLHDCTHAYAVNDSLAVCTQWAVLTHAPLKLPVRVQRGPEPAFYSEALINFNPVPYVSNVTGCDDTGNGTAFCVAGTYAAPIVISGGNFMWRNLPVKVWLGEARCKLFDIVADSTIVCTHYPDARGSFQVVSVQVGDETTPSLPTMQHRVLSVSFSCPRVNGVICNGKGVCDEAAGECVCSTSWDPQLGCADCKKNVWGEDCDRSCSCNTKRGGICIDGFNGTGTCDYCFHDHFGPNCKECPRPYGGPVCGGHGVCDQGTNGTGICKCDHMGWDESESCGNCFRTEFGPTCKSTCPGGGNCNGNGFCSWGYNGTGLCECVIEYVGADCSTTCPRTAAGAWCSGHGECVGAQCICHSGVDSGFWTGQSCDTCADAWSGKNCDIRCPKNKHTCSNRGTCSSGTCQCEAAYCGEDCSLTTATCAAATCGASFQWGSNCEFRCPGTDTTAVTVCTGHGRCDSGRLGSGACTCDAPYQGLACDKDCSLCVHGNCAQDGTCICEYGYAGTWCTKRCPLDATHGLCFGRGICDWGNTATGSCQCNSGYAGAGCQIECTGGARQPCSDNGECRTVDGGCNCYQEPTTARGAWTGPLCDRCVTPYVQPFCNATCPGLLADGVSVCSSNGVCDEATLLCQCFRHDQSGHYTGLGCERCVSGYYGAQCNIQCPGGACKACSEHGVCSDGKTGDGTCTCFSNSTHGMWWGDRCDSCTSGHFGAECTGTCPGKVLNSGLFCSGRGVCDDGRSGTGACACFNIVGEFWGGDDCGTCQTNYFGLSCSSKCPEDASSLTCSGNGVCDDGVASSGTCLCHSGWTGPLCSVSCPYSESGVCGGRGTCIEASPGVAACVCSATGNGHFAKSSTSPCSSCERGWFGRECDKPCPGGAANPCNGRAAGDTCREATGECICISGWGGTSCDLQCPGGEVSPCSGRGSCVSANSSVLCNCLSSPTGGYWVGASCDTCHVLYTGPSCNVPCPIGHGTPCSGHGRCYAANNLGRCLCSASHCGPACELSGADVCTDYACPPLYAGVSCAQKCVDCGGDGECDGGKLGSGDCVCAAGFTGSTCSTAVDCTLCDQGACDGTAHQDGGSQCTCHSGWAGRWCTKQCPGGFRNPCHGNGVCDEGDRGSGLCVCFPDWRGDACNITCPGQTPSGHACSGHGMCQQHGLPCQCDGQWSGEVCSDCALGWSGADCTTPCTTGTTNGRLCECAWGWYGATCDQECPGRKGNATSVTTTSEVCSGHGDCMDGNTGTGKCVCSSPEYYGDLCDVYCYEPVTCASYPQRSVTCSAAGCTCAASSTRGYWSGATCTDCSDGYWGGSCLAHCSCSGHAYRCSKHTGACSCHSDDNLGYWAPPTCVRCVQGYTGVLCTDKQVAVTRVGGSTALFHAGYANIASSFVIVDEQESRIIVTSTPPAVFSYKGAQGGGAPTITYDAVQSKGLATWSGQILSYMFSASGRYIWTVNKVSETRTEMVPVVRKALVPLNKFPLNPIVAAGVGEDVAQRSADVLVAMPKVLAAVFEGTSMYTFYDFGGGHFELQRTEIDEENFSLRLLAKFNLQTYVDVFLSVKKWERPVVSSGLKEHTMILSGIKNNKNVLQILTVSLLTSDIAVTKINTTFGDVATAQMRLLEFFQQEYAFVTVQETEYVRKDGSLSVPGQSRLNLVRVSLSEAVAQPHLTDWKLAKVVHESEKAFYAKTLSLTEFPNQGQVIIAQGSISAPLPSVMMKFDPLTFSVTGKLKFTYFAGKAEDVVDIVTVPSLRMSVALPATPFLRLVQMNSFAVTDASPRVIDVSGQTSVVLNGTGFISDSKKAYCHFLGMKLQARNVTASSMVCDVPPLGNLDTGSCEGQPIEVSILGDKRFSNNGVTLSVVSSATVFGVSPPYIQGSASGFERKVYLDLTGYGFVPSQVARCLLNRSLIMSDSNVPPAQRLQPIPSVVYGQAVYQTPTKVACILDKGTQLDVSQYPYYVSVSQDGQFFPAGTTQLRVVGAPFKVIVFMAESSVNVPASGIMALPTLRIDVSDSMGNKLGAYGLDAVLRHAEVHSTVQCTNATHSVALPLYYNALRDSGAVHQGTLNETTVPRLFNANSSIFNRTLSHILLSYGSANVSGLYMRETSVGTCKILVTVNPTSDRWVASALLQVATGTLTSLQITTFLPKAVDPRVPTGKSMYRHPQMIGPITVTGVDGGGNAVPLGTADILEAFLQRTDNNETLGKTIMFPNDAGTEWVLTLTLPTDLLYGPDYILVIRLLDIRSAVLPRYDGPLVKAPCGDYAGWGDDENAQYAVLGKPLCKPCPRGGLCDGTHTVVAKPGWWRESEPYTFGAPQLYTSKRETLYTNFYLCPNPDACLGGELSSCAEGYLGVKCRGCSSEYGRSGKNCVECMDNSATVAIVVFVGMFLVLIIAVIVYRTLLESTLGKKSLLFVFMKLLLNYFQMLAACLGDSSVRWPEALQSAVAAHRQVLTFHLSFSPFACITKFSIYSLFLFMLFVPVLWAGLLALSYPIIKQTQAWWERRQARRKDQLEQEEDKKMARKGREVFANDKVFSAKTAKRSVGEVRRASMLVFADNTGADNTTPKAPALDASLLFTQPPADKKLSDSGNQSPFAFDNNHNTPTLTKDSSAADSDKREDSGEQGQDQEGVLDSFVAFGAAFDNEDDPPARRDSDAKGESIKLENSLGSGPSFLLDTPDEAGRLENSLGSGPSFLLDTPDEGGPNLRRGKSVSFSGQLPTDNSQIIVEASESTEPALPTITMPLPELPAAPPAASGMLSKFGKLGAVAPPAAVKKKPANLSTGLRVSRALSTNGHHMLLFDTGDSEPSSSDDEAEYVPASPVQVDLMVTPVSPLKSDTSSTQNWIQGLQAPKSKSGMSISTAASEPAKTTPSRNLWKSKFEFSKGALTAKGRQAKKVVLNKVRSTIIIDEFPNTLVGCASAGVRVRISKPPAVSVRLTPKNPLLSFVPRTVLFTENTLSEDFSVLGKMQGEYIVSWVVTGPNQDDYEPPESSSVIFFKQFDLTAWDIVFTAWIVGYFLMHPLLVLFGGSLLECNEVNGRFYLEVAVTEDCYTDTWLRWQVVNAVGFFVYTIALPAAFLIYLQRKRGKDALHLGGFSFLINGYQKQFWYWEFVVLLRKVLLIAASVFVQTLVYRLFIAQYLVFFSLLLNVLVHPFEHQVHHRAENTILVILLFTLNLGLYYFRSDLALEMSEGEHMAQDPMLYVVYVMLVASNTLVFLAFIILFLSMYRLRLLEEGRHGLVEWIDKKDTDVLQKLTLPRVMVTLLKRNIKCLNSFGETNADDVAGVERMYRRRESEMQARKQALATKQAVVLGCASEEFSASNEAYIAHLSQSVAPRKYSNHPDFADGSDESDDLEGDVLDGPVIDQMQMFEDALNPEPPSPKAPSFGFNVEEPNDEGRRPQPQGRRGSTLWAHEESRRPGGSNYDETITSGMAEIQQNLYKEQWQAENRRVSANPIKYDRAVEFGIADKPIETNTGSKKSRVPSNLPLSPGLTNVEGRQRPSNAEGFGVKMQPPAARSLGVGRSVCAQ